MNNYRSITIISPNYKVESDDNSCYNSDMRVTSVILFVAQRSAAGLLGMLLVTLIAIVAQPVEAALLNDVNQAFSQVYGRDPTPAEWQYWADRVVRGDKTTYTALVGAMSYQKSKGQTAATVSTPVSAVVSAPAVSGFKVSSSLYPSPYGPNFLPEGTLIKSTTSPQVYYVVGGKRSYVLPSILDRWLTEAHFFDHNVVVTVSPQDFARYVPTSAKNPTFIGKVLQHPTGSQFYIDDKYRKRPLSATVRKQLKFPSGNLYAVSTALLAEFPTGPALTGAKQPGGMIIYDGPYHGGRIWRLQELSGGQIAKRLYLADRFYEAEYYPDENQRVGVSATQLAQYVRGANIETYPNGWVVGLNTSTYVVNAGRLRHITSPAIFTAMGYRTTNIQTAFPEFLKQLGRGENISAFKGVVDSRGVATSNPAPAPSTTATSGLTRINATMRYAITQINPIYRSVFDKEVTASENQFWADHIFAGEVRNETELRAAMNLAKSTGTKPGRTCRTCGIDADTLKNRWFPYLFHYTWLKNPSADDTTFWHARVDAGRNTIQLLDSNIQWLKQSENKTSE